LFFPSSFPSPSNHSITAPTSTVVSGFADEHIPHPLRDSAVHQDMEKASKLLRAMDVEATLTSHVGICMGGREAQRHVAHHLPTLKSLSRHVGFQLHLLVRLQVSHQGWRGSSWRRAFELGLENVRWFVMGDDDTVFFVENLVNVLGKYDHNYQM
ncbi:hypothetical protein Csa_002597, partial [Cucumis sativus]